MCFSKFKGDVSGCISTTIHACFNLMLPNSVKDSWPIYPGVKAEAAPSARAWAKIGFFFLSVATPTKIETWETWKYEIDLYR